MNSHHRSYRAELDAALLDAEARYRAIRNDPDATAADIEDAAIQLELAAEPAEPEWDDQDSAAWFDAHEPPGTEAEADA